MDRLHTRKSTIPGRTARARRLAADAAEADLATRLLIAALVVVLCAVVAASTLVRLDTQRTAEAAGGPACVRLAPSDTGGCATRTQVADRLILSLSSR